MIPIRDRDNDTIYKKLRVIIEQFKELMKLDYVNLKTKSDDISRVFSKENY